ncbi:fumarylacetoacetate hydrolase family protein [Halosimplex amylolyticum]|uniref:fumarylacetoacetate hydrolase family protein n=1 Tax=Halosimplex amylolyticum TaxID=3396616 RepID=UPI003F56117F
MEVDALADVGVSLDRVSVDAVSRLAPVPTPGKIVSAGLNYRDHNEEQDEAIPERPMLFGKASTAVTNPGDPIVHPDPYGEEQVDYKVELGVVVGERVRDLSVSEVYDHVAGYTVINDVSGRTAQDVDGQFFCGKSYDTFAPMGPTLVAGDSFDPNDVDIEMRVDGAVKQSSNTEQFIFDVGKLVSYISQQMTLRAGDPVKVLDPGQTCEAKIEGIGTLTNLVISE